MQTLSLESLELILAGDGEYLPTPETKVHKILFYVTLGMQGRVLRDLCWKGE